MTTLETLEAMRDRWLKESTAYADKAVRANNSATAQGMILAGSVLTKCSLELDLAIAAMKTGHARD